ncbi:MAG: CRISPR-associated protein Cas4 [Methanosarcinaceae archaeon]|nr:CRISPR-associated protein Cas4 [Methanosarcinaceae archaeon]
MGEDANFQTEYLLELVRINGVKINYFQICKTKLWLFSHNISLEKENDYVALGRELHEKRYREKTKNVMIDGTISIDFVKAGKKLEIHEIKKSKKMDEADRAQLLFYLYYFKKKGFEARGVINYPLLNKVERFELEPEAEKRLEEDIENIKKLVLGPMPQPKRSRICSKCAYMEFCFCGD